MRENNWITGKVCSLKAALANFVNIFTSLFLNKEHVFNTILGISPDILYRKPM